MCVCGHNGPTLNISGKTSDMCSARFDDVENDGYVPQDLGIDTYGDYIDISICIECGRIQEWTPRTPEEIIESIEGM